MNLGKKGTLKELERTTSKKEKRKSRSVFALISTAFIAILLVICIVGALGIGMIRGIIKEAPVVTSADIVPDEQMSIVYDANGNQIDTLLKAGSNRTNVKDYDTIPQNLIDAFVSVEDSRFWEHNGIDLKGIVRAAFNGIANGFHFSEGASTITQQLIKNSVFTDWLSEDSLGDRLERKIQEQYLALKLEETVSKEEILLSYLNTINLGNSCLGIAQASKRYFGKEYTDLTLSECAVIAAITNNPTAYNPIKNPDKNRERVEKILEDMKDQGYITEEEKQEALNDDVYSRISSYNDTYTSSTDTPNSYFVDAMIEQVINDLMEEKGYSQEQATNLLYSGGLNIYTTLQPEIQEIIDEEVNNEEHYTKELTKYSCTFHMKITFADGTTDTYTDTGLKIYFRQKSSSFKFIADSKDGLMDYITEFANSVCDTSKGDTWELTSINYTLQPQISFVLMDQSNGHVLGISGGRGEKTASLSLNRATDSTRQPGSLFKVLAGFVPALDACNSTLADVYYDGPYTVGEKTYSNYWGSDYMGYSSIRQSIVYSMNIVAVKCLVNTVTPSLAFDYLEDMGFSTLVRSTTAKDGTVKTDIGSSLVLGGLTNGVTNLETTAAYAAIANGGNYNEPTFYTKITDSNGEIVLEKEPENKSVMKETTAYLITKAMEETMDGKKYPNSDGTTNLYGTGRVADVKNMSIAGKTGTTTGTYDIWFAGFSPYYTAVIWSGFDEQQEIKKSTSANYHKEIWQAIMSRVHENLPDIGFTEPSGIVEKQICKKSGKLAVKGVCDCDPRGNMIYTEYFEEGTEPTEVCDKHVAVTICNDSGLKAGPTCTNTSTKVYMNIDSEDASAGKTDDTLYAYKGLKTCPGNHVVEVPDEENADGDNSDGDSSSSDGESNTNNPNAGAASGGEAGAGAASGNTGQDAGAASGDGSGSGQ